MNENDIISQDYLIPVENLDGLKNRLAILNRRATKLGAPAIELAIRDFVLRVSPPQPAAGN